MLGPTELLVILAILVVLFGATRLPRLARAIADARRELTQPAETNERRD